MTANAQSWFDFVLPRMLGKSYPEQKNERDLKPATIYQIGCIHPVLVPDKEGQSLTEEEDIRAFGIRATHARLPAAVKADLGFTLFFPFLDQALYDRAVEDAAESGRESFDVGPAWKSRRLEFRGLELSFGDEGNWTGQPGAAAEIQAALHGAVQDWSQDPDRYRTAEANTDKSTVEPPAPSFADASAAWSNEPDAGWDIQVKTRWSKSEGQYLLEVMVENCRSIQFKDRFGVGESSAFDVQLTVDFGRGLQPMRSQGFSQWDRRVAVSYYAAGLNCGIDEAKADEGILSIEPVPIEITRKVTHRLDKFADGTNAPSISVLASETGVVPALQAVAKAMGAYAKQTKESNPDWDDADFLAEAKAFEAGVKVLEANAQARTAFILCQKSFERAWRGTKVTGWRPFQLVGLVSECAHLADAAVPPRPLVIQMSTGGGKTELYLAITLLWAFHHRLGGGRWGTIAWATFPLRLLSLQQAERFLKVFCVATEILQESPAVPARSKHEAFSVGYYAGAENSANRLWRPGHASPDIGGEATKTETVVVSAAEASPYLAGSAEEGAHGPRVGREFLRGNQKVVRCPRCLLRGKESPVKTAWNAQSAGLTHSCSAADCGFVLPLYVSDPEVLRRQPTIIVGTLDKAARLGTHLDDLMLYGKARGRCRQHGFSLSSGAPCRVLGCLQVLEPLDSPLPAPRLLIQDELHLVSEGFGAIAAPYERMRARLIREANGKAPRLITSTATITGYARHVKELYGANEPVRFPAPGPLPGESFHTFVTPNDHRHFGGLLPTKAAPGPTLQRLMELHLRWVDGEIQANKWERMQLMYPLLVYCLSKSDLQKHKRAILAEVSNQALPRFGVARVDEDQVLELSGDSKADEVSKALGWLEQMKADEPCKAVFATSMISHGVDLEVLNVMVVDGLPNTVPEEIQATSRVGRGAIPGVVVKIYDRRNLRELTAFPVHRLHHRYLEGRVPPTSIDGHSREAWRQASKGALVEAVHLASIERRRRPDRRADFVPALDESMATVGPRLREFADMAGFPLDMDGVMTEARNNCLDNNLPGKLKPFQAMRCLTSFRDLPDGVRIMCNAEMNP